MTNTRVTLGADPEFFVAKVSKVAPKSIGPNPHPWGSQKWQNFELNGGNPGPAKVVQTFVPITGLLGGTKEKPIPIPNTGHLKDFKMQEDGPAVEFNIPPCGTSPSFGNAIINSLDYLAAYLSTKGLVPLQSTRFVELTDEHFELFPTLRVVGCDPDILAYSENGTTKRPIPEYGKIRGAGGHIHIGYDKKLIPPQILAKLLDITLLLPLLKDDKQGKRRIFNGLAGLYRDKPYGMEYRPLSNFWIWDQGSTQRISASIFKLMQSLSSNLIDWQAFFNTVPWTRIPEIVRAENVDLAENLIKQFSENVLYKEVVAHVRQV